MKTGVLRTIRRQTETSYREAVAAIAEGDIVGAGGKTRLETGIELLDKMGAIAETPGENRFRQIAQDYAAATAERKYGGEFKTALVVSPTHREADSVTDAIRGVLKASGKLGVDERQFTALRPLNLTEAERGLVGSYMPGEIVQFHQNAKGFKRGERVTIATPAPPASRSHARMEARRCYP